MLKQIERKSAKIAREEEHFFMTTSVKIPVERKVKLRPAL